MDCQNHKSLFIHTSAQQSLLFLLSLFRLFLFKIPRWLSLKVVNLLEHMVSQLQTHLLVIQTDAWNLSRWDPETAHLDLSCYILP